MLTETLKFIHRLHRFYTSVCVICGWKQLLDVLTNDINFDIDRVSGLQVGEVRDFPGFGDDGDFEVFVSQARNRQTDSFDGDRTLKNEVAGDLSRVSDSEGPRLSVIFDVNELAARVNVALYDVTAEAGRGCNSTFEVHWCAGLETAEG
jgi:hypothetical protein